MMIYSFFYSPSLFLIWFKRNSFFFVYFFIFIFLFTLDHFIHCNLDYNFIIIEMTNEIVKLFVGVWSLSYKLYPTILLFFFFLAFGIIRCIQSNNNNNNKGANALITSLSLSLTHIHTHIIIIIVVVVVVVIIIVFIMKWTLI